MGGTAATDLSIGDEVLVDLVAGIRHPRHPRRRRAGTRRRPPARRTPRDHRQPLPLGDPAAPATAPALHPAAGGCPGDVGADRCSTGGSTPVGSGSGSSTGSSRRGAPPGCCPRRSPPSSSTPTPPCASPAAHRAAPTAHPPRRRTYRPGKALAARVRARDGHCRFPGCSVPAARCDLDHVIAHPLGETVEANLQSLCRAHHGFKHHAGWRVTMTDDGECTWTAPTGRTHTTTPASSRDLAA